MSARQQRLGAALRSMQQHPTCLGLATAAGSYRTKGPTKAGLLASEIAFLVFLFVVLRGHFWHRVRRLSEQHKRAHKALYSALGVSVRRVGSCPPVLLPAGVVLTRRQLHALPVRLSVVTLATHTWQRNAGRRWTILG